MGNVYVENQHRNGERHWIFHLIHLLILNCLHDSCYITEVSAVSIYCKKVFFGNFKSSKLEDTFSDTWNGNTLYSKSSLLYSFYKSEVFHSLFLTNPVEKVLDFFNIKVSTVSLLEISTLLFMWTSLLLNLET